MSREQELAQRLGEVRARIDAACEAAGRPRDEVTLIAVTKFFPASDVHILTELGVRHIGESRDQEAGDKVASLPPDVREQLQVHFVGQLQRNKARNVAGYADLVHSVDRARLVGVLDSGRARAREEGQASDPLGVLIQVDLGEGEQAGRGGVAPDRIDQLADVVGESDHLELRGVMAIAPLGLDEAGVRAAFTRLVAVSEHLRQAGRTPSGATLVSAGMSGDLELAVSAGATHLRVGTAILGSRPEHR